MRFKVSVACSRLQDSGEQSFSKKKWEKRAGAATAPFPKSRVSYFRFARLIRPHYTIWEPGTGLSVCDAGYPMVPRLKWNIIACENSRLSSLIATWDISPEGTSAPQRQKFHTDDVKAIRNLSRSSIYCFSYCLRRTDKRQTVTWVNAMDLLQYSPFSWNIFFFGRGIWVLLELVRRRKQNFTIIDQERHKIEQINIWSPLTTGFIMQTLIYVISMVFLSVMRGLPLWRNVPSEEERRGTAIFAG